MNSGNGIWQFSTNAGASWQNIGNVSRLQSLLLGGNDRIRFVPDGENGTVAEVNFLAWDQTRGTSGLRGTKVVTSVAGGTSPFSSSEGTASIAVSDLNDAPILDSNGIVTLESIDEHQTNPIGEQVGTILASSGVDLIQDSDSGAIEGIAIFGMNAAHGNWQYSINGGGAWTDFGPISSSAALLLRSQDLIRFVPVGPNLQSADFEFRAWDQYGSTAGQQGSKVDVSNIGGSTPYSSSSNRATINVTNVNHAPTWHIESGDSVQSSLVETNGSLVAQGSITVRDLDVIDTITTTVQGVAISGVTAGLQSDTSHLLGMLSTSGTVNLDAAGGGRVAWQFHSNAEHFDYLAAGEVLVLTYQIRVSDGLLVADQSLVVEIIGTNDRPVLNLSSSLIMPGDQMSSSSGIEVSSFINGAAAITDLDHNPKMGIAIDSIASSNGSWQYQLNGTSNWTNVEPQNQDWFVLLKPTDRLRFVSEGGSTSEIRFRAWDQTFGQSGLTNDSGLAASTSLSSSFSLATIAFAAPPPSTSNPPSENSNTDSDNSTKAEESPDESKSQSDSADSQTSTGGLTDNRSNTPGNETQPIGGIALIGVEGLKVDLNVNSHQVSTLSNEEELTGSSSLSRETYYERKISTGKLEARWDDVHRNSNAVLSDLNDAALSNFFASLDKSAEQLMFNQFEIGVPTFVASTASMLTVGYLAWIVRGGVLLTTFMTSLPTWKTLDIGPLLDELDDRDQETIEQIVDTATER